MLRSRFRQICSNPAIYCWIGLLCAYAALYRRLALANQTVLSYWFNSDTLFPVHLFIDWIRDGYPLSGWSFGIAPCWFPDLPFTALVFFLTGNVVLANLLAGLAQFILLILGFQLCWRALGLTETRLADCCTLLIGIGVLICTALRIEIYYPSVWKLVQPQTHVGTLVLVMFGAALCIRLFRGRFTARTGGAMLAALGVVSLVGVMSDPMFIPQMTFAITVAAGVFVWIGRFRFRTILMPLIVSWSAILAGVILNKRLFSVTDISVQSGVTMDRFLTALGTFLRGAGAELKRADLLHISAALWLLFALGAFLGLLRRLARQKADAPPGSGTMVVFFLFFSALSGLSSAAAIIVGGSNGLVEFKDYRWSADHYLHSIFYEAVFGWALLLSLAGARVRLPAIIRQPSAIYGFLALVIFLPAAYAFSVPSATVPLHRYSPPLVRYLDSQASRHGLRVGAADYWNARPVTLFSRQGLRAFSVLSSLEPNPWVSNRYWYTGTPDGSKKAPEYSFVIPEEPVAKNRENVVKKLGDPDDELDFGGKRILIYRPSTSTVPWSRIQCTPILGLAKELLNAPGKRLEIPAACLNGAMGEVVGQTRVAPGSSAKPGLLAFGPYLSLAPGRYAVNIHCQIVRANPEVAATWEIGYFCCGPTVPAVTLARGTIQDDTNEIRTHISVTPELSLRGLELRIQYLAAQRMVFEKLTIAREQ